MSCLQCSIKCQACDDPLQLSQESRSRHVWALSSRLFPERRHQKTGLTDFFQPSLEYVRAKSKRQGKVPLLINLTCELTLTESDVRRAFAGAVKQYPNMANHFVSFMAITILRSVASMSTQVSHGKSFRQLMQAHGGASCNLCVRVCIATFSPSSSPTEPLMCLGINVY